MLRYAARVTFSQLPQWHGQFRTFVTHASATVPRKHSKSLSDANASDANDAHTLLSDPSPSDHDTSVRTIMGIRLPKTEHNSALLKALSLENASADERRRIRKQDLVQRFRRSESDTGSPEVQSKSPCSIRTSTLSNGECVPLSAFLE